MRFSWGAFLMRLHCLGTAGFHPNATRHTSCYCLPEAGIVLDAGTGIFRLAPLIETDELDLLMSHAHLDHICGLTFLLDVFYQRPVKKLRIWGEAKKLDAIRTHLFSEFVFPVELDAEWLAIDDLEEFTAGGATVTWKHQEHPGGSVAYRMDWPADGGEVSAGAAGAIGKSLVYATDTTGDLSEEGITWCRDADLMIHECYFEDSMAEWAEKTGHSWTSRVAEIAKLAGPGRVLITHINPLIGAEPVDGVEGGDLPDDFEPQCRIIAEKSGVDVVMAADQLVVEF